MASAIFTVFFNIIKTLANVVLAPINLLVVNLFPSFSGLISTFNNALNLYVGNTLNYFFYILPPNARTFVLLYVGLLVSFYTISITTHAILKVYTLIKNIKIW